MQTACSRRCVYSNNFPAGVFVGSVEDIVEDIILYLMLFITLVNFHGGGGGDSYTSGLGTS